MKDSRFQYREQPNLSPGACAVCKGHGPVIDYMVNVPILGRLYICVKCLEGGLSNVPLSDEQQEEVDKQHLIDELTVEVEDLNGTLDRVRSVIDNWREHTNLTVSNVDSSPVGHEQEPARKNSKAAGKKSSSAGKQDSDGISSGTVDVLGLDL